ncbi:hypothetical protein SVAN01_09425 [Stagonosporopsis vannaccii]|nr:hypothetical protein SVAN01_09425 [Stagonosporopsis vannaccii]
MQLPVVLNLASLTTVSSWTLDRYSAANCRGSRSIVSSIGTWPRSPYCLDGPGESFYLRNIPSNLLLVYFTGPNCTGTFTELLSRTHTCFDYAYESLGFGARCADGVTTSSEIACNGLRAPW